MLECQNGERKRLPRPAGVLNNAIWRRGVAMLCGLCHAYHNHIRPHFETSRTLASCPLALFLLSPRVFSERTRAHQYRDQRISPAIECWLENIDGTSHPASGNLSFSPTSMEKMLFPSRYAQEFQWIIYTYIYISSTFWDIYIDRDFFDATLISLILINENRAQMVMKHKTVSIIPMKGMIQLLYKKLVTLLWKIVLNNFDFCH